MSEVIPLARPPKAPCPICRKAAAVAFRPFCSKRCADLDLNRWLSEGYRVETPEAPDSSDANPDKEG